MRDLVIVVPITSVDRGWPHHVSVRGEQTGLPRASFAMTEQPRTISVARISRRSGVADRHTLAEINQWLRDFIGL